VNRVARAETPSDDHRPKRASAGCAKR
jgi:hypothetical protein